MNEERLKQLLDRYYNGTSSEQEEALLREYFISNDLIPGYEAEKEIFCHYSGTEYFPGPSDDLEEKILKSVYESENNQKRIITGKPLYALLSIAATLLLLFGSYYFLFYKTEQRDTFSDPTIAYAETMKILTNISVKLNKSTMKLQPLTRLSSATLSSLESIDKSALMITAGLNKIQVFDKLAETGNQNSNSINNK